MSQIRKSILITLQAGALLASVSAIAGGTPSGQNLGVAVGNTSSIPGYYPDYTSETATRAKDYRDHFVVAGYADAFSPDYSFASYKPADETVGMNQALFPGFTGLTSFPALPLLVDPTLLSDQGRGLVTTVPGPEAWGPDPMGSWLARFQRADHPVDPRHFAPPPETMGAGPSK